MAKETVTPGVLTRNEAADYLRVCVRTLDYLVKDGELKRLKLGRKTLYRVADLMR